MNNIKKILIITLLTVINSSLIYSQEEDNVEEVVVISSKIPVPLSEVVGSVTLITQDDLEARVVSDLGDILENTVGVGEHPNIIETVEQELDIIAGYEDKLSALKKHFKDSNHKKKEVLNG